MLGGTSHSPAEAQASEPQERANTSASNLSPTGFYVHLQSKSDFLKSKPEFDTDNIISISASQLSLYPHPDSDTELPPPQFYTRSSQTSQDHVIADSQPGVTQPFSSQQTATVARATSRFSQTTIPDSQDFSTDLSQSVIEVPATVETIHQPTVESPKPSQARTSGSSIPSRQPDTNQVSFGHFSISDAPLSAVPLDTRGCFGCFLTQPDFEPGEFSLPAESRSQSQSQAQAATTATIEEHQATAPEQGSSLDDSHQPAQRHSPLPGEEFHFMSQSGADFLSAFEDYEVVPDTSQQRATGLSQHCQFPLSQNPVAISVSASNTVHSHPVSSPFRLS